MQLVERFEQFSLELKNCLTDFVEIEILEKAIWAALELFYWQTSKD